MVGGKDALPALAVLPTALSALSETVESPMIGDINPSDNAADRVFNFSIFGASVNSRKD